MVVMVKCQEVRVDMGAVSQLLALDGTRVNRASRATVSATTDTQAIKVKHSTAQLSSSSCLPVDHKASHACTKTDGGYESLTNNIESAGKRVVVNIVCDYDEKCSLFLFLSLSLFQLYGSSVMSPQQ
jgi:hypothetical protein